MTTQSPLTSFRQQIEENFVEKGADLEHDRWARWYKWQRDNTTPEAIERWNRQSVTPYSALSEEDKEKDRKQVRPYLPLLQDALTQQLSLVEEEIEKHHGVEIKMISESLNKESKKKHITEAVNIYKDALLTRIKSGNEKQK